MVDRIRLLSSSKGTVLIRGESGTGKDLVASLLHDISPQCEEPLVRIDCAGTPPHILETHFFGNAQTRSRFERAGSGTIVLGEIAALGMNMQANLLQLIEHREFQRADRTIHIDARILALTSTNLEHAIGRRSFREDLYYRLNVTSLLVAPLRERQDDIVPLAEHFLAQLAQMHRRPKLTLHDDAKQALIKFPYPGNVRQLRALMERVVSSASGPEIHASDLPPEVRPRAPEPILTLEELERSHIANVLQMTQGKKSRTAEILGISRKTLLEKRKKYGME